MFHVAISVQKTDFVLTHTVETQSYTNLSKITQSKILVRNYNKKN